MTSPVTDRKPTIVVVDDEVSIRSTMARFFERQGWQCVQFPDGLSAEQALFDGEAFDVDVVLCDLRMPKRSGLELYQRAAAERPDLAARFVLSTGDINGIEVQCPLLAKPYPLSEVSEIAERILRQNREG